MTTEVARPAEPTDLDDGAPHVQAWLAEKTRLELIHACALKQLAMHMGSLDMDLEIDGHPVQIREVTS